MARSVYFAFYYEDVIDFRANVVRQSWRFRKDRFRDNSMWEEAKKKGATAIKKLIDENLVDSGVTCVLIGSETYKRRWVRYEIIKSLERGNGLFATYINRIRGKDKKIKAKGANPFLFIKFKISNNGNEINFFEFKGGKWIKYKDCNSMRNKYFGRKHWGKTYKLSDWFKIYCYINDNGKIKFTKWVERAAKQVNK